MRVQHNIAAMTSYRNYNNNTKSINKNLEKLSSGYKINRAGDDAAGLAISEKMRAQITGLEMAQKNAKDGISLVQTAEGALTEVHSMLNRMFSLAEQSANGTYSDDVDREQLQKEVNQLRTEINRIADSSNFNGMKLLNGDLDGNVINVTDAGATEITGVDFAFADGISAENKQAFIDDVAGKNASIVLAAGSGGAAASATGSGALNGYTLTVSGDNVTVTKTPSGGSAVTYGTFSLTNFNDYGTVSFDVSNLGDNTALTLQIGDTADGYNQMSLAVKDIHVSQLGSDNLKLNAIDISQQGNAQSAMDAIKAAINTVSDIRGGLGAIQNRLDHTINNLSVMQENIQDAESTIRDTDVADEMMKYTKNSILVQSAQAMLAQANQQPQGVLQLLQ